MITKEFPLEFSDINYPYQQLVRDLGYSSKTLPEKISNLAQELYSVIRDNVSLCVGYGLDLNASIKVTSTSLEFNSTTFLIGEIIANQLKNVSNIIIFAATAGDKITQWYEREKNKGNLLHAFIVDTIGSGIAEAAADKLEEIIQNELLTLGLEQYRLTNRLSPGYCSWNVSEQTKLFGLLPPKFCNITLSSSAIMFPLKSVSGIIGIGANLKRQAYPCATCQYPECYKRFR